MMSFPNPHEWVQGELRGIIPIIKEFQEDQCQ